MCFDSKVPEMHFIELRGRDGHPKEGLFYTCFVLILFYECHYGLLAHELWHIMLFTEEQERSSKSQADIRGWEAYREILMELIFQLKQRDTRNSQCFDCTERVRVRPSGCS